MLLDLKLINPYLCIIEFTVYFTLYIEYTWPHLSNFPCLNQWNLISYSQPKWMYYLEKQIQYELDAGHIFRYLQLYSVFKRNQMFALPCCVRAIFQEGHKSQPSTRECQSKTNIPSMWPCPLRFPDLRYCCCVSLCVGVFVLSTPIYSSVLPLSFTVRERNHTPQPLA